MRSRACGATSTRNGDSWRVSSRPKGLGDIHPLSVRSGFLQTSRIGLVMAWKRHCVPMETLRRGRLGLLHRTSLLGLVRWCLSCRFCVADQSLRCLPMTILAQLRDRHSCYDERSMVKKKKVALQPSHFETGPATQKISSSKIAVVAPRLRLRNFQLSRRKDNPSSCQQKKICLCNFRGRLGHSLISTNDFDHFLKSLPFV